MLMSDPSALSQLAQAPISPGIVSVLLNAVSEIRPVLVLDLDETVVFATPVRPRESTFSIKIKRRRFYIKIRPGFREFFERISSQYEIFFFTASKEQYASPIIDYIAPSVDINHRIFYENCPTRDGKDLSVINRPIDKILLIDDIFSSGSIYPRNLVKIKPWMGEFEDNCLCSELLPLLEMISGESDIPSAFRREYNRETYPSLCLFK